MKPEPKLVERKIGDEVFRFEAGRLAGQANGAVLATVGETTVLATATSSAPRGDADFFPLTVDVEERMYAAGKIPGGFFRREGKCLREGDPLCRLIDRPLRPAFPDGFRNEVHVVATDPGGRRLRTRWTSSRSTLLRPRSPSRTSRSTARSAACGMSHINGEWVANPTEEEQLDCDDRARRRRTHQRRPARSTS